MEERWEFLLTRPEWDTVVKSVRGVQRSTDLTILANGVRYEWTGLNRPAKGRQQAWISAGDPTGGDIFLESGGAWPKALLIQEEPRTPCTEAPTLRGLITRWTSSIRLGAVPGWHRLFRRLVALGFELGDYPQSLVVRAAMPVLAGFNGRRPVYLADIRIGGRPKKILGGSAKIWVTDDIPDVVPEFEQGFLGDDVFIPGEGALYPAEAIGAVAPDGEVVFVVAIRPGTTLAAGDRLRPTKTTIRGERVILTVPV